MTDSAGMSRWRSFWERGDWWRALLLAAAYYLLYQVVSIVLSNALGTAIGDPGSPSWVLLGFALPIAVGGALLVGFAGSLGWLRELFGPQPIRGSWWMWIPVVVVVLFNVLRFAAIDYGKAGAAVVAAWLVTGLFVGFAEEVLTRGLVVNLVRKAGRSELVVAVVSAAVFAALHAGNLLTGQPLFTTVVQLGYTFGFGVCMYLALRVTGNLIWPILLHATTDPSIFLLNAYPGEPTLVAFARLGNIAAIVVGLVLIFFVRGRVGDPPKGAQA